MKEERELSLQKCSPAESGKSALKLPALIFFGGRNSMFWGASIGDEERFSL